MEQARMPISSKDFNKIRYDIDNQSDYQAISVSYEDRSRVADILQEAEVLAVIEYGSRTGRGDDPRRICLATPELGNRQSVEVWRAAEPVETETEQGIVLSRTADYLFGSLVLDDDDASDITNLAETAYLKLVETIREYGFPHLLRMWNYFSAINAETYDLERYQQFCHGRHEGLVKMAMSESMLPAASALGTHAPGFVVYFLAAKETGAQIENPKQVSAFHYPQQYAPRSPSFSRAVYKQCSNRSCFYISGTASITGHETRHIGDIEKQLDETLSNIEVLINEARKAKNLEMDRISDITMLKIYLRTPEDEALVRNRLAERFGHQLQYVILHADICRQNLLIEIEGVYLG